MTQEEEMDLAMARWKRYLSDVSYYDWTSAANSNFLVVTAKVTAEGIVKEAEAGARPKDEVYLAAKEYLASLVEAK